MLTDIIVTECIKRTFRPDSRASTSTMKTKLKEISPHIIRLNPITPIDELRKRYMIRDLNDLKILYSADKTDSDEEGNEK